MVDSFSNSKQRGCRPISLGARLLMLPAAFLLPLGSAAQEPVPPADLILTGGRVYTADAARPRAEAVVIRGDRVVFVGSAGEAALFRGPATRVVELQGRTVVPGFVDSHGHLPGLGSALRTVDLVGLRSYEAVVQAVRDRAATTPPERWIVGRGWDQNEWPDTRFPTHHALSAASPDHPVYLTRVDGHAAVVNARALELAGIDRDTPDPDGGLILRDAESGEATGVLVDAAMRLVQAVIPPDPAEEVREGILAAQRELHRLGITSIHDAGVPLATVALYEEMARGGELSVRNYVMVREPVERLPELYDRGPRVDLDGRGFLTVRAIKISIDGALGSRGAALLEPYADEPENSGLTLVPRDALKEVALAALDHGFQLNVHGIGDRGNRIILDVYEEAFRERSVPDHRFRVEHAQILHRHDIPRFAELGVIPSMQAIHQASDMPWAESRLGFTRLLGAYAWRSLLDTGVVIPGGSDFPVEPANPLLSFHAAVTRQNSDGWPAGGWFPEQRMDREEALLHMTLWGAYAAFQEDRAGSITPGKWADLVVLSRDIMTVPADEILDARVEMTVVGGTIVHETDGEADRAGR